VLLILCSTDSRHQSLEPRSSTCFQSRDPEIPAVFANPEFRDWPRLNPGITRLQKFVKKLERALAREWLFGGGWRHLKGC